MGRLSLPRLSRWRQDRAAIEIWPALDPLFSGTRCSLRRLEARKFVLDGEIAIPAEGAFSFDALLQRIHPAASRIRKLADETPAMLIVFRSPGADAEGRLLTDRALDERRRELEFFFGQILPQRPENPVVAIEPQTRATQRLAQTNRKNARWRDRQATRSRLSLGRAHRHAKDQELPQRRLRGRGVPLQRRHDGRRFAAAGSVRSAAVC